MVLTSVRLSVSNIHTRARVSYHLPHEVYISKTDHHLYSTETELLHCELVSHIVLLSKLSGGVYPTYIFLKPT